MEPFVCDGDVSSRCGPGDDDFVAAGDARAGSNDELIIMKKILVGEAVFYLAAAPVYSQESRPEIIGKTHAFAVSNAFSGPGSDVRNLASTYDMSLFEFNWGGKQSLFNG